MARVVRVVAAGVRSAEAGVTGPAGNDQWCSVAPWTAAPAIYQKRIEKAYEIRLVAFREEAVAYKIDSQRSESGALDWRRAQYEDIYGLTEATPEMCRLSARFLHHAGLHYGVFDLIVDRKGRLWFLECNADGQWAWLEPQGDGPIAQMFARQIQKILHET